MLPRAAAVGKSRLPTLAEAPAAPVHDGIDRVLQSVRHASRSARTPSRLGNEESPRRVRRSAQPVKETHRDRFRNARRLLTAWHGFCRRPLTEHEVRRVACEAAAAAGCGCFFAIETRLASNRSSSSSVCRPPWEGFQVTERPEESYIFHYDSRAPGLFAKLQISSSVRTASPPPSPALAICSAVATND